MGSKQSWAQSVGKWIYGNRTSLFSCAYNWWSARSSVHPLLTNYALTNLPFCTQTTLNRFLKSKTSTHWTLKGKQIQKWRWLRSINQGREGHRQGMERCWAWKWGPFTESTLPWGLPRVSCIFPPTLWSLSHFLSPFIWFKIICLQWYRQSDQCVSLCFNFIPKKKAKKLMTINSSIEDLLKFKSTVHM